MTYEEVKVKVRRLMKESEAAFKTENEYFKQCPTTDLKSKEYMQWRKEWLRLQAVHNQIRSELSNIVQDFCSLAVLWGGH